MSTQSQNNFIESTKKVQTRLAEIGFIYQSTINKGYATYIDFILADKSQLTFMYGPSDWNVEILLNTKKKSYAFKDLMEIPSVAHWVKANQFKSRTNNRVRDELDWFVELITFVVKEKS